MVLNNIGRYSKIINARQSGMKLKYCALRSQAPVDDNLE